MNKRTFALLVLGVLGCEGSERSAATGAAATGAGSATPVSSAPPPPSAAPRASAVTAALRPACRVLDLAGEVTLGAERIAKGGLVYGDGWLELGKGASLTLRHTVTTRELTVTGPGRALVCAEGAEEVLLGEGGFQSVAGPGVRPGAEVMVFTPTGTVSYGDAQISIRASKGKTEVTGAKGDAWVLAAKGATRKGPEKVGPKDKAVLTGPTAVEPLVKECERAAEEAETLARAVLGPADGGTLGDRAAAHLQARKLARGACGSARAALSSEPNADKRAGFVTRVEQAGRRWRSLGVPGSPAPKSSGQ